MYYINKLSERLITLMKILFPGLFVGLFICLFSSTAYAIDEYEFMNIAYNYIKNNTNNTETDIITSINDNMPSDLYPYLNDNYNILFVGDTNSLDYYVMPLNFNQKLWIRQGYNVIINLKCYARGQIGKNIALGNIGCVTFDQLTTINSVPFNETQYYTPFDIYKGRNESGATLWTSAGSYNPSYLTTNGPFESTPPTYFYIVEGVDLQEGYNLTGQSYISGDNIYLVRENEYNFTTIFTLSELSQLYEFQKYVYYFNIYQNKWMLSVNDSLSRKDFSGDEYSSEYIVNHEENIFEYAEPQSNIDKFIIYILVPKDTITFSNIVIPVYFPTRFTKVIGNTIYTDETFSGDYIPIYNDNVNNDDLLTTNEEIISILTQTTVDDSVIPSSGEIYSPNIRDDSENFFVWLMNSFIDIIEDTDNVNLTIPLLGENFVIPSNYFVLPAGSLRNFISLAWWFICGVPFLKFIRSCVNKIKGGNIPIADEKSDLLNNILN